MKKAIVIFTDLAADKISEAYVLPFITSANFTGKTKVLSLYASTAAIGGKEYEISLTIIPARETNETPKTKSQKSS